MSLQDKVDEANKSEYSASGGGWFKTKEGANSIRVLCEPEVIFEDYKMGICYTGCNFKGSPKYLTYVLDRADGAVKLYKLPYGIFQSMAVFEKDEDTKFEGFPMPYDLKIHAVGAGTKDVKYTVTPSPKLVLVVEDVMASLTKKKSVKEMVEILKAKNKEKHAGDVGVPIEDSAEGASGDEPAF